MTIYDSFSNCTYRPSDHISSFDLIFELTSKFIKITWALARNISRIPVLSDHIWCHYKSVNSSKCLYMIPSKIILIDQMIIFDVLCKLPSIPSDHIWCLKFSILTSLEAVTQYLLLYPLRYNCRLKANNILRTHRHYWRRKRQNSRRKWHAARFTCEVLSSTVFNLLELPDLHDVDIISMRQIEAKAIKNTLKHWMSW